MWYDWGNMSGKNTDISTQLAAKERRREIFNLIVVFFVVGCIFGTYWEETICLVRSLLTTGVPTWVSRRGLLYGPFSPVYGIGAVLIYLVFYRTKRNVPESFIGGALLGGALEVGLSLLQEWIFGTISWDYTGRILEIAGGRTTIPYMVVWGALIAFCVAIVFPLVEKFYRSFSQRKRNVACAVLAVFLVLDIGISVVASVRQRMRRAGNPADTTLEVWIDTVYNDERMKQTYDNTKTRE